MAEDNKIATGSAPVEPKEPRKKRGPNKPKQEFATVEQLNELTSLMKGLAAKLDVEMPKVQTFDAAAPVGSTENPGVPLNPEWRRIVDEILGPDFGIMVDFDKDGTSMKFTVIVPKNKSNAKPDYMEYYKHDYRTIALNPAQTGIGVRQWCERIKRNLGRSIINS